MTVMPTASAQPMSNSGFCEATPWEPMTVRVPYRQSQGLLTKELVVILSNALMTTVSQLLKVFQDLLPYFFIVN